MGMPGCNSVGVSDPFEVFMGVSEQGQCRLWTEEKVGMLDNVVGSILPLTRVERVEEGFL
jgi:hypothetical protein